MIEEVLEEQSAPRVNRGELIEELIVKATGGTTDYFNVPDKLDLDNKKTPKSRERAIIKHNKNKAKYREKKRLHKELFDKINTSVSNTPEIKQKRLEKLGTQTLPENGIYAKFGVTSGVPKTDLIDPAGTPKYSAKASDGAQFVSAQGPESAALWYVSLKQAAGGQDFSPAVTNALNKVPQDIKNYFAPEEFVPIKKSGKENLQEHLKNIYSQIFNSILEEIGVEKPDFMKQFYIEGMTGNVKFDNGKGSADTMLSWNTEGNPFKIEDIKNFIAKAPEGQLKIRVSDRGHERGGAIRGDIRKEKALKEELPTAAAQKIMRNIILMPSLEPEQDTEQIPASEETIQELGNIIKDNLFDIYNRRGKEVGLVDLLDYLKTDSEARYVDMAPLYSHFGKKAELYDSSLEPEQLEET